MSREVIIFVSCPKTHFINDFGEGVQGLAEAVVNFYRTAGFAPRDQSSRGLRCTGPFGFLPLVPKPLHGEE